MLDAASTRLRNVVSFTASLQATVPASQHGTAVTADAVDAAVVNEQQSATARIPRFGAFVRAEYDRTVREMLDSNIERRRRAEQRRREEEEAERERRRVLEERRRQQEQQAAAEQQRLRQAEAERQRLRALELERERLERETLERERHAREQQERARQAAEARAQDQHLPHDLEHPAAAPSGPHVPTQHQEPSSTLPRVSAPPATGQARSVPGPPPPPQPHAHVPAFLTQARRREAQLAQLRLVREQLNGQVERAELSMLADAPRYLRMVVSTERGVHNGTRRLVEVFSTLAPSMSPLIANLHDTIKLAVGDVLAEMVKNLGHTTKENEVFRYAYLMHELEAAYASLDTQGSQFGLLDTVLACMEQAAPQIVPLHVMQAQSKDDRHAAAAFVAVVAAYWQAPVHRVEPPQASPHPRPRLGQAWMWLARFLNRLPRTGVLPSATAHILHSFLTVAGTQLVGAYVAQMTKVRNLMLQEVIPRLQEGDEDLINEKRLLREQLTRGMSVHQYASGLPPSDIVNQAESDGPTGGRSGHSGSYRGRGRGRGRGMG